MASKLVLLLLAVSLLVGGCATPRAAGIEKTSSVDSQYAPRSNELAPGGDTIEPVRHGHGGARAARWSVFVLIVVVIVVVDVFLLVGYHHSHDCFPCTRTVVIWCD